MSITMSSCSRAEAICPVEALRVAFSGYEVTVIDRLDVKPEVDKLERVENLLLENAKFTPPAHIDHNTSESDSVVSKAYVALGRETAKHSTVRKLEWATALQKTWEWYHLGSLEEDEATDTAYEAKYGAVPLANSVALLSKRRLALDLILAIPEVGRHFKVDKLESVLPYGWKTWFRVTGFSQLLAMAGLSVRHSGARTVIDKKASEARAERARLSKSMAGWWNDRESESTWTGCPPERLFADRAEWERAVAIWPGVLAGQAVQEACKAEGSPHVNVRPPERLFADRAASSGYMAEWAGVLVNTGVHPGIDKAAGRMQSE